MASAGTSSYLPALPVPHEREGVGRELQTVLVELVDSWHELADTVAERAVALGYVPDAQAQTVAAATQLKPVAREAIEDRMVVRELAHRIADVSERVRERMNHVGELDLASQDVLIEVVRALEKQQWMLRVQLGGCA